MLSPEILMPTGPPPQAVLDQRWLWSIFIVLLGITFTLRLIGLDVAGALLTGLMLCFGIIMTRDGMQDMAKYALVYAVLCGLNFFFDILPLITELGGRITRTTEPVTATTNSHGVQQTTYTLTTKTTPFFDPEQGLIYNMQSLAMIISPISMALGIYLAISANNEIQRHAPPLFEEDFAWNRQPQERPAPEQDVGQRLGAGDSSGPARPQSGAAASSSSGSNPANNRANSGREAFERFQGQGHKLS
mmetsp:Transcript_90024/g.263165  ORF Transcript_90024/g.263165 Transcript_90024/m.263165 type:complete len:246 (-) Transcript_90024:108-845(-)